MLRISTLAATAAFVLLVPPAQASQRTRPLSAPERFVVPSYRRDGAKMLQTVRRYFHVLQPHLVEVARDCPRPRGMVRVRAGDSPHLVPSRWHSGRKLVRREVRDRLVFAAAFANARGGYRIGLAIGHRTLHTQALLWNWRLVQKFRSLRRRYGDEKPLKDLARWARPTGEVANPARLGCGSPHLTGGAVDVMLLSAEGEPLVNFRRHFLYRSRKAYRERFLTAQTERARHARLLEEVMYRAGFVRYCREAWHFEARPTYLHRAWKRKGRPGRCYGAGAGTWDPRREPIRPLAADLLAGLPPPGGRPKKPRSRLRIRRRRKKGKTDTSRRRAKRRSPPAKARSQLRRRAHPKKRGSRNVAARSRGTPASGRAPRPGTYPFETKLSWSWGSQCARSAGKSR